MNLFRYTDYKLAIQEMIRENRGVYGYKSQLAQAAGCKSSFFSQVLNAHVHLTPEHAVGLADFWGLRGEEKDYFVELVHFARASTKQLKGYVKAKLDRIKKESEAARMRHVDTEVGAEWLPVYYSSWVYVAIHFLVTIPEFRTAPAIAKRLGFTESQADSYLRQLEQMRLLERKGGQWSVLTYNITAPKGTPYSSVQHVQWQQRAMIDTFNRKPDSIHFTGIYSLSREDIERLRAMMLQLAEKSGKIARQTQDEELICVLLDLFVV